MSWFTFDNRKTTWFFWATIIYILYIAFPIFADLTGITPELPALLVVLICTVTYPKAFSNKVFAYTLAYLGVLLLYLLVGRSLSVGIGMIEDSRKFIIESAWILPAVMIFSILRYLNDINLYKKIALASLAALVISFLYLIPLIQVSGYSLREEATRFDEEFHIFGLPGYTLMHAYVFLVPALCYAFKSSDNNKSKALWLGFIVLFFYLIIHTYVTTSLFVTVIILLATVFYKKDSKTGILVFFLIAAIVYGFYLLGLWAWIIDLIMPIFSDTAVEFKLVDIQRSLSVGHIEGGSIEGRMDYHQVSINAFWKNPIFGDDSAATHSSILDRLGGFGLFGFIPFGMIFVSFIMAINKTIITNSAKFFWFCTMLAVAVFLYNKGLFGCEGWLFFFVIAPSLMIYIQEKELKCYP